MYKKLQKALQQRGQDLYSIQQTMVYFNQGPDLSLVRIMDAEGPELFKLSGMAALREMVTKEQPPISPKKEGFGQNFEIITITQPPQVEQVYQRILTQYVMQ